MITKIKIFEENNEPKIGDYIILHDNIYNKYTPKKVVDFLNNNIGQIVDYLTSSNSISSQFDYIVKFDIEFKKYKKDDKIAIGLGFTKSQFQLFKHPDGCRMVKKSQIKYYHKDKDSLKTMSDLERYNI